MVFARRSNERINERIDRSRCNYYFPAAAFELHSLPPYPINPPGNGVLCWICPYFIALICISYFFSRAFSALSAAFSASISVTLACKMTNNSLMLADIADAAVAMIEDITAVCGVAWCMTLTYNKNPDSILFLTIIYTSHHTTPQWSARLVAPWHSFSSSQMFTAVHSVIKHMLSRNSSRNYRRKTSSVMP